jgi:phage gp36-like protein
MANWIILSGDNIRLLDTETIIFEGIVPKQDLDTCVTSACHYVRGYLAGMIMEPAPAVPPEVVDDVMAIARYSYLTQEPTGTLLTEVRQKEYDNAIAHLRDIAKELSTVTQGDVVPPAGTGGNWGSATRIAMRTESVPPVP